MIADFEQRLADVLGTRLPSPFGGHVAVTPGNGVAAPSVLVGVRHVDHIDDAFGIRPELVPGAGDPRRVARLRCQVALVVHGAADRVAALRGVDDVLYAVDAPDFQDGSALRVTSGDPGFLIDSLVLGTGDVADDGANGVSSVGVVAQGWFWPVGTPGQTGVVIGEVRVRGVVLPIEVAPARPSIVAGGAPITMTLQVQIAGLLRLGKTGALPFGQLVVQLFSPGGRPGSGSLMGGTPAVAGSRLLSLADGAATFDYVPPATPAADELVVALDDGEGGAGVELGRFALVVKAS
jgi:hypothetical protein